MQNWFDMAGALEGFDSNPEYLEKMTIDYAAADGKNVVQKRRSESIHACAWVRNRNHKKKLIRRFLSINPDMDYSKLSGTRCEPAIYLCFPEFNDGKFFDPKMEYNFNPYSRVFLSPRGDIRKYHGEVSPCRGSFALGRKEKEVSRITNRRIRHLNASDELPTSHSYCKKLYGPLKDDLW